MITIYHGTTKRALKKILKEGITPRGNRDGNWKDNMQSRPDLVYLTYCYGAYYASMARKKDKDEAVILKIKIDEKKMSLYPDDEFLIHAFNLMKDKPKRKEFLKIIKNINPKDYKDLWRKSLDFLGTVSTDFIPLKNIVAYTEERDNLDFIMNCDPSISPLNYKICGGMYREHLDKLKWKDV